MKKSVLMIIYKFLRTYQFVSPWNCSPTEQPAQNSVFRFLYTSILTILLVTILSPTLMFSAVIFECKITECHDRSS